MYLQQLDLMAKLICGLARAMPEEHFSFVPTQGAFANARTFSEQVKHVATLIFLSAAIIKGERSPQGPGENDNGPSELQSKSEILRYLLDAIAYARDAMMKVDGPCGSEITGTYFGPMPRAQVAAGMIFHSFNHYGQMVVYARLCGAVPESLL